MVKEVLATVNTFPKDNIRFIIYSLNIKQNIFEVTDDKHTNTVFTYTFLQQRIEKVLNFLTSVVTTEE